jgi:hypothetical protein
MLQEKYEGPCKKKFFRIADETAHKHRRNQIEAFEGMYASLKRSFGKSKEPGGLAIAKKMSLFFGRNISTRILCTNT